MRMILQATSPNDVFNAAVKDGSAGAKMQKTRRAVVAVVLIAM